MMLVKLLSGTWPPYIRPSASMRYDDTGAASDLAMRSRLADRRLNVNDPQNVPSLSGTVDYGRDLAAQSRLNSARPRRCELPVQWRCALEARLSTRPRQSLRVL